MPNAYYNMHNYASYIIAYIEMPNWATTTTTKKKTIFRFVFIH